MRVDHLAYQRALHITTFGLLLQALVGAILLVFGLGVDDGPSQLAAIWCLIGLIPWIGLLVVFAQHRLERLEALEEDELSGSGATALFERSGEAVRPAARRLRLAYKWMLPGFSVAYAIGLIIAGWMAMNWLGSEDLVSLPLTEYRGWIEAILLSSSAVCFVCSRYLAGMAAQEVWRHLRAGAGQMVSVALVLGAMAVGVAFRFFDIDGVIETVSWAVPVLMFAAALEIVLSLVLNAYRPRRAGEFPRASFDSPSLSLLAQPGSVVRSINEAVNYQFGFDITSSWGYQLLLRSSLGLGGLAVLVLLCMSTVVVVGPRDQGLRLRSGAIVGDADAAVKGPGPFVKLPWPFESASLFDVTEVRTLAATPVPVDEPDYYDWREPPELNELFDPAYVVRSSSLGDRGEAAQEGHALVVPDVRIAWRVNGDELLQYLHFVADERRPRQTVTQQQRVIQLVAKAEMTRMFSTMRLDQVLSTDRNQLGSMLRDAIQKRLDSVEAGIAIVAVEVPDVRPPKDVAIKFEGLPIAIQQRDQTVAAEERREVAMFTALVGDYDLVDKVLAAVDRVEDARTALEDVRADDSATDAQLAAARAAVQQATHEAEALLRTGGGQAWQAIANAERDYWVGLMDQRVRASRIQGQSASWEAAPDLYRQRAIMEVYADMLPNLRKYIVGIDPDRLNLNVEMQEHASTNTIFSDTVSAGSDE